ncbi:MAG: sugar nucleotide-binding protein [Rhodobacteraceae bacterium]|nr:sugar nucleotide-binding protein [Paracoccaceae bacterium]
MTQTVLILGASGRFGRAADKAFSDAGWHVLRFDRKRDQLSQAACGVDVIVNAANMPYTHWAREMQAWHTQVIDAARSTGATVIVPGNVYVFGLESSAPWGPQTSHAASNPLGRLRVDMEAAYRASGVRTILLRAGDFLDTSASGNWFDAIMTKRLGRGIFTYPGAPDVPHSWAYLPDLARACVGLAERRSELPVYADIPFAGYTLTGAQMLAALNRVLARPAHLRRMSWLPIQLARPVWPLARHLLEMRYLWDMPHSMDAGVLKRLLPEFVPTPVEHALANAIPAGLARRGREVGKVAQWAEA